MLSMLRSITSRSSSSSGLSASALLPSNAMSMKIGQVGAPSFWIYQCTYIGAQIIGNAVSHEASAKVGARVGFAVYIIGTVIAVLIVKYPTCPAPASMGVLRKTRLTL